MFPITISGHSDDKDDYYYNGYDDGYDEDHEHSSSSLGAGPILGIILTVISLVISLCGYLNRSRRPDGLVARRHVTGVRVPIVENDQLQREYERAEGGAPTPKGLAPLYTPLPTTSSNETSESAQAHGARDNTAHVPDVQQEETTV